MGDMRTVRCDGVPVQFLGCSVSLLVMQLYGFANILQALCSQLVASCRSDLAQRILFPQFNVWFADQVDLIRFLFLLLYRNTWQRTLACAFSCSCCRKQRSEWSNRKI
ncbi:hypothetical protein Tcan_00825, partial [Toxocara canis]